MTIVQSTDAPAAAAPISVAREPRRRRKRLRTPIVPQMEEQDCGAACLAIVLGGFGRPTPLHETRRACGVSRDGASLAAVARAAAGYGLLTRGRRISGVGGPSTVAQLSSPSIVLLKGLHFAVFEGRSGRRARVNDPATGRYATSVEQFEADFSGVALEFEPGPEFVPDRVRLAFTRRLLGRVRPYRSALGAALASALLVAAPTVLAALVLRVFATQVVALDVQGWAWPCAAAIAALSLVVIWGSWLQQRALSRVLLAMALRTSGDFVWRMLRLRGEFFQLRQLGGLVTRVQLNDGLASLLTSRLTSALAAAITAAISLAVLIWLDPLLSLVAVGAAIASAAAFRIAAKRRANDQHRLQSEEYRRDGVAFAGIAGIETLKAEGAEDSLFSTWVGWQARALNTSQAMAARVQGLLVVPTTANVAANGLIVTIGGIQLLDGSVSIGTLLAFQLVMSGLLLPIAALVSTGAELLVARAQAAMLEDVLDAEPDPYLTPIVDPGEAEAARLCGRLELRDVVFGYDRNRPPVLDGVSMTIEPGRRVAVVGATGSGKSTLGRLAAGVLEPWAGGILYDGRPRHEVPRSVLTTSVAYVQQQLRLFEGSVRDNLTLWDPTVSESRIRAALDDARLTEVIDRRGGLDGAEIAEDAANLSGGERQRLELARAFVLDPALVILDEATSALDAENENRVDEALRRRGCSCLVIAHRLSTVRDADEIVVLHGGRVVERGRHDELISAGGRYLQLVEDMR